MRILYLAGILVLVSCAIPAPLPTPVNCNTVSCAEGEYCFEYNDSILCIPAARETGFCNLPCLENQECRHNICLSRDPEGENCEFDGQCGEEAFCIVGRCTEAPCVPGEVVSCYTGLAGTAGIGECRSGYYLCTENFVLTQECIGEITPSPDEGYLACNGRDDNCDGVADPDEMEAIDIIFALDRSGSMETENLACSLAVQQAAALYDHPDVRMGLIIFPQPESNTSNHPISSVEIPLVSYSEFSSRLNAVILTGTAAISEEPSYDLVFNVSHGNFPEIQRTSGARLVIIMFTDEKGQSYLDPLVTEQEMCTAMEENDVDLFVITYPEKEYWTFSDDWQNSYRHTFLECWDECATVMELSTDYDEITRQLGEIASSTCQ
jgi:hypothetical protein